MEELSEEEHQKFPGDYEAHSGQGDIASHANENLGQTDTGIVMLRRFLRKQVEAVAAGDDPVGVSFDEKKLPVKFEAGNWRVEEPYEPKN